MVCCVTYYKVFVNQSIYPIKSVYKSAKPSSMSTSVEIADIIYIYIYTAYTYTGKS